MCYNESLRMEPPVLFSSLHVFLENCQLGDYSFSKSHNVILNIQQLMHDPQEWREHDKYIPERFDHHSQYYLRPDGSKRNPLSFTPFFGGRRVCLGKTFAEIVAKYVVVGLLSRLHFEFEDPKAYHTKATLNVDMVVQPVIKLKVSRAKFD